MAYSNLLNRNFNTEKERKLAEYEYRKGIAYATSAIEGIKPTKTNVKITTNQLGSKVIITTVGNLTRTVNLSTGIIHEQDTKKGTKKTTTIKQQIKISKNQQKVIRNSWNANKKTIMDSYLDLNPEWADKYKHLETKIFNTFKKKVLTTMDAYDIGVPEALRKALNSETFVSPAERSRQNFLDGLFTKHRKEMNAIRRELGYKGDLRKKDDFETMKGDLIWDSEEGTYYIEKNGKKLYIDISNSPEEVTYEWRN